MRALTTAILCATLVAAIGAPALAQENEEAAAGRSAPYSPLYNGAFVAMGAFAGPALTTMGSFESAWSSSFGAWTQLSIPLQIFDFQGAYCRSHTSLKFKDGQALELGQDTLSLVGAIHPAFLLFLEADTLNYVLGGAYFLIGGDVERVTAKIQDGARVSEFDLGLQLGAGIDIPLDNIHDGGAFWLGFQYRFNEFDFETSPLRNLGVSQHLLLFRLSYRRNGLLVAL